MHEHAKFHYLGSNLERLLTPASDIELWNSFIQGDQEALGSLFRRYYNLLYQYGSKICPDKITLEDCIQELFTELWSKRSGQPTQSVKAYLLHALKYKLYKSFRNKKNTISLDQNGPFDMLGAGQEYFELSHENFLIRKAEDEEKLRKIVNTLNQLPARQKEIIYLKIYQGLSYEEISGIMQVNYQVVRNLLCQALKTFRKLMMASVLLLAFTV